MSRTSARPASPGVQDRGFPRPRQRRFYGSRDIEDIVAVIGGAEDAREKVLAGPETVRAYLREQFTALLRNELFVQSVTGHLGPKAGPGRFQRILKVLRESAGP